MRKPGIWGLGFRRQGIILSLIHIYPFPTLAVCFVGNFGGPNFISGYYDRKVPAFAPTFLGGDVKNCG